MFKLKNIAPLGIIESSKLMNFTLIDPHIRLDLLKLYVISSLKEVLQFFHFPKDNHQVYS